jgi:hypothetical protein
VIIAGRSRQIGTTRSFLHRPGNWQVGEKVEDQFGPAIETLLTLGLLAPVDSDRVDVVMYAM